MAGRLSVLASQARSDVVLVAEHLVRNTRGAVWYVHRRDITFRTLLVKAKAGRSEVNLKSMLTAVVALWYISRAGGASGLEPNREGKPCHRRRVASSISLLGHVWNKPRRPGDGAAVRGGRPCECDLMTECGGSPGLSSFSFFSFFFFFLDPRRGADQRVCEFTREPEKGAEDKADQSWENQA